MRASILTVAALGTALLVGLMATGRDEPRVDEAAQTVAAADATTRIVRAAQAVLQSLDDAGRARMQFQSDDDAQRRRWSNFPQGMVVRQGLRMGDLTPPQRQAVTALLQTAFSARGYAKVNEIMRADDVFRDTAAKNGPGGPGRGPGAGPGGPGGGRPPGGPRGGGPGGGPGGPVAFGADEYFLAFIGPPSVTEPWMLQFGGHHLAVNLTMTGRRATVAPTLTGAQPATYTVEGRTISPLGREHERAVALMASLSAEQRAKAVLGSRMADLVLGPGQDGRTIQPEGLAVSTLSAAQQAILIEIVREWTGIATESLAAPRLDEIRGKLPQTYFAWSGPTTLGSAAYFRIQGPTLHIEYAPQGDLDHIHTIYRDPTNDYGSSDARR